MTNLVITTQEEFYHIWSSVFLYLWLWPHTVLHFVDNLCLLNGAYKGQKINKVLQF